MMTAQPTLKLNRARRAVAKTPDYSTIRSEASIMIPQQSASSNYNSKKPSTASMMNIIKQSVKK